MAERRRLIKKYPNRRLYDTQTSAYITLADVKALVLAGADFSVVDAKSNEDLTRSILLQIILEEETGGMPMFSTAVLATMIRFYGNTSQSMMGQYLETNINAFSEMQSRFAQHAKTLYGDAAPDRSQDMWAQFLSFQGPAMQNMMGAYVEQSQKMFQQMQEQTKNMFGGVPFPPPHGTSPNDLNKK
jgi:polyhydroxyalkanoate synthesis repressor PhaR